MKQIKVIHIDDDSLILTDTRLMLSNFDEIDYIGGFNSLPSALTEIINTSPDVIFLDVKLENTVAFNIVNLNNLKAQIVFLTGYPEFAFNAYEVGAVHYILKPATKADFQKAIEIAKKNMQHSEVVNLNSVMATIQTPEVKTNGFGRVTIFTAGKTYIETDKNIEYFMADGSNTKFYLADKSEISSGRLLKYYREQLQANALFFEISRSAIINLNWVKVLVRDKYKLFVEMHNGNLIPVSKFKKKALIQMLKSDRFVNDVSPENIEG